MNTLRTEEVLKNWQLGNIETSGENSVSSNEQINEDNENVEPQDVEKYDTFKGND